MKEILLCKYGELTLKGLNRGYFEKLLYRDMKKRLEKAGNFSVTYIQSTVYVEPLDDDADIEEAFRLCRMLPSMDFSFTCFTTKGDMVSTITVTS